VVLLVGFEARFARALYAVLSESASLEVISANVPAEDVGRALGAHAPRAVVLCWEAVDATELERVTCAHPDTGVVVLAEALTAEQVCALGRCGAVAALERHVSGHVLRATVVLAGHGMRVEPRAAGPGVVGEVGCERDGASLSAREAEVLGLLECGESVPAIARVLGVSVQTVKSQRRSVYRKLDVHSRSELEARRDADTDAGYVDARRADGADVIRLDCVRRARGRARLGWLRAPLPHARWR
jgi:DNA-binding NarL/FixJ family response regulator